MSWFFDHERERREAAQKVSEGRTRIQRLFRSVFGSPEGKQVLTMILEDLRYFDQCKTDAEKALSEFGKFLVSERLGCNESFAMTEAILASARDARHDAAIRRVG